MPLLVCELLQTPIDGPGISRVCRGRVGRPDPCVRRSPRTVPSAGKRCYRIGTSTSCSMDLSLDSETMGRIVDNRLSLQPERNDITSSNYRSMSWITIRSSKPSDKGPGESYTWQVTNWRKRGRDADPREGASRRA